jgi:protein-tyrosine phosphatase
MDCSQILPCLYLGSILPVRYNLNDLYEKGVRSILTVCSELKPVSDKRFTYETISIEDDDREEIYDYFSFANEWITERLKYGGVYVHCAEGRSRSVTIVCSYLMKTQCMSVERALATIRKQRPIIKVNPGFIKQLCDFERFQKSINQ